MANSSSRVRVGSWIFHGLHSTFSCRQGRADGAARGGTGVRGLRLAAVRRATTPPAAWRACVRACATGLATRRPTAWRCVAPPSRDRLLHTSPVHLSLSQEQHSACRRLRPTRLHRSFRGVTTLGFNRETLPQGSPWLSVIKPAHLLHARPVDLPQQRQDQRLLAGAGRPVEERVRAVAAGDLRSGGGCVGAQASGIERAGRAGQNVAAAQGHPGQGSSDPPPTSFCRFSATSRCSSNCSSALGRY